MTAPVGGPDSPVTDLSPRVLLLFGPSSYRAEAFLAAAARLGYRVARGVDVPAPLADQWGLPFSLDFRQPERAADQIARMHAREPFTAIVAVDDRATGLAALANQRLGLPYNDPDSALAARDKWVMRQRFAAAGSPVPVFHRFPLTADPADVAARITYPGVVKPLRLSGSRGVIRVNDAAELTVAWERARRIVEQDGIEPDSAYLLIETYLPGVEVAVEGLLSGGDLQVLAIFDKPDPLEGPFFEETIYVAPSRLPAGIQDEIARQTARAAAAIGLREGPVHAELRINDDGVWPIELAGRSIGGLCSSVLEFGLGETLEMLILRHAAGEPNPARERDTHAAGVMMIPIPNGGILRETSGEDAARAVPLITGVEITAKVNHPLVPLPEGESYLGFIFARGETPAEVEAALRAAHAELAFRIDPSISLRLA